MSDYGSHYKRGYNMSITTVFSGTAAYCHITSIIKCVVCTTMLAIPFLILNENQKGLVFGDWAGDHKHIDQW